MGLCSVVRYTIGQAAAVRHLSQNIMQTCIYMKKHASIRHIHSRPPGNRQMHKRKLRAYLQMMVGTTCGLLLSSGLAYFV